MEDKKYSLTLSDIQMLIGLGANAICEENELDDKCSNIVTGIAADICHKIKNHLIGKCQFTKEEVASYEMVAAFLDFFIKQEDREDL